MLIRLQRKKKKFVEIKNSATTYIPTGASIIELDGKYGFLCGEGLDMISFGAFVMCGTQLAEHAAKICPIIS